MRGDDYHHERPSKEDNDGDEEGGSDAFPLFQPHEVTINVGGTAFMTTRNTLCAMPDTFFTGLMRAMPDGGTPACLSKGSTPSPPPPLKLMWRPNERGQYFIDRDPTHFMTVLNLLRAAAAGEDIEEELQVLEASKNRPLLRELRFYGLLRRIVDAFFLICLQSFSPSSSSSSSTSKMWNRSNYGVLRPIEAQQRQRKRLQIRLPGSQRATRGVPQPV